MSHRILHDGQTVEIYDPHQHSAPLRVNWDSWLDLVVRSVHAVRYAMSRTYAQLSPREYQDACEGYQWLQTNDIHTKNDFLALEKRLPLLLQPPDPSRIVRCERCKRPLSDPISKVIGRGPECRKVSIYTTSIPSRPRTVPVQARPQPAASVPVRTASPAVPSGIGPQEPPADPRIFNRPQPDGTYRPLSDFFKVAEALPTGREI